MKENVYAAHRRCAELHERSLFLLRGACAGNAGCRHRERQAFPHSDDGLCALEESEIGHALEPIGGIQSLNFQLNARTVGIQASSDTLDAGPFKEVTP